MNLETHKIIIANLLLAYQNLDEIPHFKKKKINDFFQALSTKDEKQINYFLMNYSWFYNQLEKVTRSSNNEAYLIKEFGYMLTNFISREINRQNTAKINNEDVVSGLRQINNNASTTGILDKLVNAKNRRAKDLGSNFNCKIIRENLNVKDYFKVDIMNVDDLVNVIGTLEQGERIQLLVQTNATKHMAGIDVQRDSRGNLHIFCIDSAYVNSQPLMVRELYTKLIEKEKIDKIIDRNNEDKKKINIKVCHAGVQKDESNCAIFNLSILWELNMKMFLTI